MPSNLPSILNKLTVSIGIAEFPCCATSSSELLNKADLMLYQAKKNRKKIRFASKAPNYQKILINCKIAALIE
ncbi:hypothetical protein [Candidatus Competibacter phosphatis]|uniref:hypothetical protein n=1 Tax=Candidatus Competibacter phosphatis TaxID=221280 RepID=UPI003B969A92